MATNALFSTVLTGLVLLAIVVAVLRLRNWRRGSARPEGAGSAFDRLSGTMESPTAWTVGFLLLVLLAVAGALAFVGALPVPESARPAVTTALLVAGALVLAGFVFAGVYASVRNRGFGSAPAVGVSSVVVGLLALLVVVLQLFLA